MHAVMTPPRHPTHSDGLGGWLRRRSLTRFELGCVAAFHLTVAAIITFTPKGRIITPSTQAIFGTIQWPIWVAAFTATGVAAATATVKGSHGRLVCTWAGVFPLGIGWIYGFTSAPPGRGNVLFPLVWSFLLIWWVITAIRTLLGGTENRWGGG